MNKKRLCCLLLFSFIIPLLSYAYELNLDKMENFLNWPTAPRVRNGDMYEIAKDSLHPNILYVDDQTDTQLSFCGIQDGHLIFLYMSGSHLLSLSGVYSISTVNIWVSPSPNTIYSTFEVYNKNGEVICKLPLEYNSKTKACFFSCRGWFFKQDINNLKDMKYFNIN